MSVRGQEQQVWCLSFLRTALTLEVVTQHLLKKDMISRSATVKSLQYYISKDCAGFDSVAGYCTQAIHEVGNCRGPRSLLTGDRLCSCSFRPNCYILLHVNQHNDYMHFHSGTTQCFAIVVAHRQTCSTMYLELVSRYGHGASWRFQARTGGVHR